ncbi:MAG: hypothetical protein AAGB19_08140 [Cyanobacteria bacterium P01_F01_bin.3]
MMTQQKYLPRQLRAIVPWTGFAIASSYLIRQTAGSERKAGWKSVSIDCLNPRVKFEW